MALYESVFVARQDISAAQAEGLADQFAEIVTNNGGTVSKKEYWGLRNLAFRIKKNRKGHYTLLNLDAPPKAVSELERNMRLHDDILRYLTIRVEELEEGPSAILRSRDERGGRDRDRGGPRDRGPRGDRGDRGDRGPRDRGDRDDRGPRGDRGDRGDRGPRDRGDRDDRPPRAARGEESPEQNTSDEGGKE